MLASCGSEDADEASECPADPDSACWTEYARTCQSHVDESSCVAEEGKPFGGSNLSCKWLQPERVTKDGNLCDGASEPARCVAGYFVGEGGPGCSPQWDRADQGEGRVLVTNQDCVILYEWGSCEVDDDAPSECDCAM